MSKYEGHTPGPWAWDDLDIMKGDDSHCTITGLVSCSTASHDSIKGVPCFPSAGPYVLIPEHDTQSLEDFASLSMADAALIADAPKILAQRDRLVDCFRQWTHAIDTPCPACNSADSPTFETCICDALADEASHAVREARAAIAEIEKED